jgi:hypothetical protein
MLDKIEQFLNRHTGKCVYIFPTHRHGKGFFVKSCSVALGTRQGGHIAFDIVPRIGAVGLLVSALKVVYNSLESTFVRCGAAAELAG